MYWELINTIQNTKQRTGGIQDLIIHPETLRQFKSEAKQIVPNYESKVTTSSPFYEILCGISIKTSPDCQPDKVYFGIRY